MAERKNIMKLKTFEKVNSSARTTYVVMDRSGLFIEEFTVDHTRIWGDVWKEAVGKRVDLIDHGADVVNVHVNSTTGLLEVAVFC